MEAAADLYTDKMSLQAIADTLSLNPIKVRKLLITAGVYKSDAAKLVRQTFDTFRETQDYKTSVSSTMAALQLSRPSVTSYLPYEKGVYFPETAEAENISAGAERQRHYHTGATGSGKTYLACAFGMEACRQRYKTKYVRLPDLLLELEMARNDGTYKKVQGKYANPVLLIIDEWLLLKPTESEQHDILELLHRRRRRSSTIFCSQYDSNGWYDQLGGDDSPLAEAILDRIKHDAYKINIIPTDPANYRSMREVYGLDPALSE